MQNIINSFKATLYERTSSPFLGSFVFYWIICNYKFLIVLFSKLEPEKKLESIEKLYPEEIFTLWKGFDIHYYTLLGNGFLIPLILTLLYIFVVPYPSRYIYKFWKNKQNDLIKIKNNIDDKTPISEIKAKNLRNSLYDLQKKYYEQFEEITNLRSLINNSNDIPNILPKKEERVPENLIEENPKIKNLIITTKMSIILEDIGIYNSFKHASSHFTDKIEEKHYMSIFEKAGLITVFSDENLSLTDEGRKALVNYRESDEIPF